MTQKAIDQRITSTVAGACIEHRRGLQVTWSEAVTHDAHGRRRVMVTLQAGDARTPSRLERALWRIARRPYKTGQFQTAFDVPADYFDRDEALAAARITQAVAVGIAQLRQAIEGPR